MKELRCWEYRRCGRQPNGGSSDETLCPAALSTDFRCWTIAGTLSGRTVEGTFARQLDTCIICGYYNKMQDMRAKKPRQSFFLFGQYLSSLGVITSHQIIQARSLQLRQNRKIGALAKSRELLSDEQIQQILILQEETLERFGTLAIELGYLTEEQVRSLVLEQEDHYLFFGEALVKMGLLNEAEMFGHLKTYNTLKLQKQQEQEKLRKQLSDKA